MLQRSARSLYNVCKAEYYMDEQAIDKNPKRFTVEIRRRNGRFVKRKCNLSHYAAKKVKEKYDNSGLKAEIL